MRNKLYLSVFLWLGPLLFSGQMRAASTSNCIDSKQPETYDAKPGDLSSPTRLDVQRPSSGLHSLQVDVCYGVLRLVPSPAGSDLRLQVTSRTANRPLGSFLKTFSMENGQAAVNLQIPKNARAIITLFVPLEKNNAENYISLAEGIVRVEKDAMSGDRRINVGAGSAYIKLDDVHGYYKLQTNIAVGRLSDSRPGGHGGRFIVSRDSLGDGRGLLKINIGVGNIYLKQDNRTPE